MVSAFSALTLLVGRQEGIRPVKTEWWGVGMVICLERGADLHMAQLMPLPLTVSCFSKIQIGLAFLVPAHPGSPGHRAVKRVCVKKWYLRKPAYYVSICLQLLMMLNRLTVVNCWVLCFSPILKWIHLLIICYASAVLAFCLCLCLSQVGVLLKRLNVGSHKTTAHNSQGTLDFWCQRYPRNFTGSPPPTGAPNAGGMGQNRRLSTNDCYISKTVQDRRMGFIEVE